MQTNLCSEHKDTQTGRLADSILRRCVHCGFCNATCPTYQIRGDELDGPRGRIYQIKLILEGNPVTDETRLHLDRCLTCLNCETTCPSGVAYGELLEIGREIVEQSTKRSWIDQAQRAAIRNILAYPRRFGFLLRVGRLLKPLIPGPLGRMIPAREVCGPATRPGNHVRKVLLLNGCVQPDLSPQINDAATRLLNHLGISALPETPPACCGALHHHTSDSLGALDFARHRIDAWWPFVELGIEAIVSTASGCGVHIKHYGELLKSDPQYRDKAVRVSKLTRDIAEVLDAEDMKQFKADTNRRIVFHPPCTLQHGQKLSGLVEQILDRAGFERILSDEAHLCCGAAGSYTLLQPKISNELRQRKIGNLTANKPDLIVSANIGCIHHLSAASAQPVRHWVELLAESI